MAVWCMITGMQYSSLSRNLCRVLGYRHKATADPVQRKLQYPQQALRPGAEPESSVFVAWLSDIVRAIRLCTGQP